MRREDVQLLAVFRDCPAGDLDALSLQRLADGVIGHRFCLVFLVDQLLDGLADAPSIAVLGYSSGGPNALAAAHYLAALRGDAAGAVCVVGLISPDGPYMEMEPDHRTFSHSMPITPEEASEAAEAMAKSLRATYEAMAGRPERYEMLMADLNEATRQSTAASAQDTLFERTRWDFRLEHVQTRVLLWQGEDDEDVPSPHNMELMYNRDAEFRASYWNSLWF